METIRISANIPFDDRQALMRKARSKGQRLADMLAAELSHVAQMWRDWEQIMASREKRPRNGKAKR